METSEKTLRKASKMVKCAIVGINWGDEGKGRMVDLLTEQYDVVIRYQGGGNAGHTVVNEYGKFALHLLPSGIFRKGVLNILGNGVALDLENLWTEIEQVRSQGIQRRLLFRGQGLDRRAQKGIPVALRLFGQVVDRLVGPLGAEAGLVIGLLGLETLADKAEAQQEQQRQNKLCRQGAALTGLHRLTISVQSLLSASRLW